jgi:hypothetical protein
MMSLTIFVLSALLLFQRTVYFLFRYGISFISSFLTLLLSGTEIQNLRKGCVVSKKSKFPTTNSSRIISSVCPYLRGVETR